MHVICCNYAMNARLKDTALFTELYDVQPQAIVWLSPVWNDDHSAVSDFEYTYCNPEALRYLGISRDQASTLRLSNSHTVSDFLRDEIMSELIQILDTGESSATNIYNAALNKYARVFRTRLRGGILSIIEDRTEENRVIKQMEQQTAQLQSQKRLLDNLLMHSPAGISVTEVIRDESGDVLDGRTILANNAAEEYIGVPREIYLSRKVSEIDPALLSSPLFQMALHTLATGEPFHTQYFFEERNKWIELSVAKMDDQHLVNIFTDITSTKNAQLELENAANRLQAVFNASQSGMFTFAPVFDDNGDVVDFRFVITNPNFAAYVNETPETLQGALGSTFFPGYLTNGVFDMYKQTYLTNETLRKDVHYNVDGHDLYLDLLSTKVDNEVLVTFTDLTTLKRTQFQLEKLVEELKRSNTSLEEFAHAASHDLKEPIRKIGTFSNRLKTSLGDRLNEMENDLFSRMEKATARMSLLVDDLLSYSYLSLTPPAMEEVDLNRKLGFVLSDLELQVEEKNAIVNVGQLPVVKGYKRQMQQLFQNLLSNALKYSKEDEQPRIDITSRILKAADVPVALPGIDGQKEFHLIEVRDNGIGFDPQYAERIFQMFQRLHGRSEYSGTGVGLSIARKVVENHKGYIWATGIPGEGAVFHILLPKDE
jgi:signal transduction histidine kinase